MISSIPPAEENLYGIVDTWMAQRLVSTVDAVGDQLLAEIVDGDLPEEMPRRQERIARKFGISKPSLREALASLEAGGLPSGRKPALQILENLYLHVDRYVRLHMGMLDTKKDSNNEHRQLPQACRKWDAEAAVNILREHIENIHSAIQTLFVSGGICAKLEK